MAKFTAGRLPRSTGWRTDVLKARYFRLIDTKDWFGVRQLFAPDLHAEIAGNAGGFAVFDSAEAFIAMLVDTLTPMMTVHHGHMPEVQLTSATTACGIWAMDDDVTFGDGSRIHGFGHYHETYVKLDDEWRIQSLRLTRLRVDKLS